MTIVTGTRTIYFIIFMILVARWGWDGFQLLIFYYRRPQIITERCEQHGSNFRVRLLHSWKIR